ncbi:MAG: type II secretion system protein M [Candidatus Accumulibacter sp.]|jgi:type II secretory pathway component PulM|uniref:type II secretion system protein GspM n=1 Tax=Accumulibacter sp. TaxID=2053492 RepID=UPI001ACD00FE|nr:type II secretion system protein GspM [Accumulibacter sp.]MBN8439831.1 type II secretion system protein M [Accumulibacter sp.]
MKGNVLPANVQRLVQSWATISPRERRLVGLAAVFVLVVLVYLLTDWMLVQRQRLQRALPRAEASMLQMQKAVEELARLRGQSLPARLSGTPLQQALQTLATGRGLNLAMHSAGDRIEVSGRAGFDALIEWLAAVQAEHGVRCISLEAKSEGTVQVIKASLALPADL